jgi:nitrate reductase alpha subunit
VDARLGEGFVSYRPPVHLKALHEVEGKKPNGNREIALNFITPHQKWASTARTATT